MKGKAHLTESEDPLISGKTYRAKCGAEIPNAVLVFMWDAQALGRPQVAAANMCRFCWCSNYNLRYLSGIIPGEMAKQMENLELVEA
ncbi:MAG TPA: hypothetical protein VGF44_03835 [Terriglobales bacterium]